VRFPTLTIGRRLLLLGATGVAAAVIMCGVAFFANDRTESTYSEVDAFGQARVLVREIETLSQELNIDAYRALLKVSGPGASAEVNDDATEITDRLDALFALPLTDEDKGRFKALRDAFDEYLASIHSVVTAATGPVPNAKTQDDRILTANDNLGVVMADTSDDIERDIAELQESLNSVQRQASIWMIAVVVVSALTVIALTLALSRSTVRRMQAVAAGLDRLADGDLTRRMSDEGGDEVGGMSRAVDQVAERFTEIFRSLSATGGRLTSASSSLLQVADRVGSSSAAASSQAEVVAHSANAVTANVHAVAAGSEQMRSSIGEIARNANEAAQVALGAVQAVESTTGTMSKLGDSSREIGDVIRLITSIAEQTNLLALNATIEAARAGDAGKGFAVVADEVKQLAQETARATEDISRRVEAIQEDAESASSAIGEIASVIARINEFQSTIAAAVEEQTSSTDTISAGVSIAASGSEDIAHSIAGVASAAGETATSIIEARANAAELSSMSDDLARIVAGFRL
jgi:methyl-accepting chemotaxis protein